MERDSNQPHSMEDTASLSWEWPAQQQESGRNAKGSNNCIKMGDNKKLKSEAELGVRGA